jgi:putative DNA primase/helicase
MNEILQFLNSNGFHPPIDKIACDGKIHRFDRDGKLNAWFIGFQNTTTKGNIYHVAVVGDWKTMEEITYKPNIRMTAHDKKAMEKSIVDASKKIEDDRNKVQAQAAIDAKVFFSKCQDHPGSDYLVRKKISNLYGCKTRMSLSGRLLVVPMKDVSGKMWGYQEIYPDGSKRFGLGQKKSGNFHTIGDLSSETIYICEGFATGASIFEAMGGCVIVAFDSGNLIHVCKSIAETYPDKKYVVCGDDDIFNEKNVGRECAETAAKSIMAKTVFPVFEKNENKLTDFNDLHVSEGLEIVKFQIGLVQPEKHTVKCLGYDGDDYCFITNKKPQVTRISVGSFSKTALLNLMDLEYWETRFRSKRGSFDVEKAIDAMMRGCRSVGVFRNENIRGTGVWQDQGRTVINLGDRLWCQGKIIGYADFQTRYIYESSHIINAPRVDYLSAGDTLKFKRLLDQLSWKNPSSSKILLGWLALSGISPSISWRPHLWLTGPAGSGKTTVMKEIIARAAVNCIQFLGKATEAGIRYSIGSNCLPILFDENETTDKTSMQRVSNIIDLFRVASSETDAKVVKGSASGKAVSYSIRFMAAVSSISVGLSTEQDLTRFSVLEMVTNKNNGFMDRGGIRDQLWNLLTDEYCQKFWSRSVYTYDRWKQNFKTLYPILMNRVSSRYADQYGSLMAGYYTAIMDEPLTVDEANTAASEDFIYVEEETKDHETNEINCLDYILGLKINEGGKTFTVMNLIELCKNSTTEEQENYFQNLLMNHGFKIVGEMFHIRTVHPSLKNLMKESEWPINWGRSLKRIDGTESSVAIFFGRAGGPRW